MIKVIRNEETGILEAMIPAVLTSIPENSVLTRTENKNGQFTPYYAAKARVEYPDGTEKEVDTVLWKGSQDVIGYKVGDNVILATQIEGDYKGNSAVALPPKERVDVDMFEFAEETTKAPVATEA